MKSEKRLFTILNIYILLWKPLNVITDNVITLLLWSDCPKLTKPKITVNETIYIRRRNNLMGSFSWRYQLLSVPKLWGCYRKNVKNFHFKLNLCLNKQFNMKLLLVRRKKFLRLSILKNEYKMWNLIFKNLAHFNIYFIFYHFLF